MVEQQRVAFAAGALRLEGILHSGERNGQRPAAVVCHPHPLYGGNMFDHVVGAVCTALTAIGWIALRFNFRGVGGSQGVHGGGLAEQADVLAALDFLSTVAGVDAERLAVAGYSFGSWVGLSAGADDGRVKSLVAISPPVPMYDFGFLGTCGKRKLLIYGDRDEYVNERALRELLAVVPEPKEAQVFPGVDHFWLSRDRAMAEAVGAFLSGTS